MSYSVQYLSVVRQSTLSNDFFSESAEPDFYKFHVEPGINLVGSEEGKSAKIVTVRRPNGRHAYSICVKNLYKSSP